MKLLNKFFTENDNFEKGKVYITGFGPGDLSLMSIKALSLILNADVIIYDYLVDKSILNLCSKTAEIIYVGKKAGSYTLKQEEINALIVKKALENKIVLRLKGGDPFVFGRGGEEAIYCKDNNIDFEIVPGITSSMASAAYAGIPVTHRNIAVSFCMLTGHEDINKKESQINWEAVSGIDTIAVYMGVKNMQKIINNLLKYGKTVDTPAAIIRWGTYNRQEVLTGTLENIYEKSMKSCIKPPALLIIGNVVDLRGKINWFENKIMFGKKIIVTRSRNQISKLSNKLKNLGAEVIEFPTIDIIPPKDYKFIDRAIKKLEQFNCVVFTSANGVEFFNNRILKLNYDIRKYNNNKVVSIGKATTDKLKEYCLKADYEAEKFVAESLFDLMKEKFNLKNLKILLPRAEIARPFLKNALVQEGAVVEEITAYRTIKPDYSDEEIQSILSGETDWITFTSSSTVNNFFDIIKDLKQIILKNKIKIASIGPITTSTLKEYGITPDVEAEEYTINGLVDAIIERLED